MVAGWNHLSVKKRQEHRLRHYTRPLYWLRKIVLGLRERVLPESGLGKDPHAYIKRHANPTARDEQSRRPHAAAPDELAARAKPKFRFVSHRSE
jgi:hypothetical protein